MKDCEWCPKCLGRGQFQIGCALVKGVFAECPLCLGTGMANKADAAYYKSRVPMNAMHVRDDHWQLFKGVPYSMAAVEEGERLLAVPGVPGAALLLSMAVGEEGENSG